MYSMKSMYHKNFPADLEKKIADAREREENDDHLSTEERKKIVEECDKYFLYKLPTDNVDRAFCQIIYNDD